MPALAVSALLIGAMVILAGLTLDPARPARPVIVTTSDWAPYVGRDLPDHGPVADMVRLVMTEAGYQPTVQFMPWEQALEQARRGQAFAAFPLVASADRDTDFLLSDPLVTFEYVLFYDQTRPRPAVNNAADLADLRVASIAGYDYWPELDAAVGEYTPFETSIEAFRALADGEVDLVPEGQHAGFAVATDPALPYEASRFTVLEGRGEVFSSTQDLHLLVSRGRDGSTLLDSFNTALARVQDTPEYTSLLASLDGLTGGQQVRLAGAAGELVRLVDEKGGLVTVLPRGSTAQVLTWPELPTDQEEGVSVEVKVTSGPGLGLVGMVGLQDLELLP